MSISIAIITNMLLKRLIAATLVLFCTGTTFANEKPSSWQFEAGASAGRPTPILLNAGVGYKNLFFYQRRNENYKPFIEAYTK